jgi:hypothetical protein
MDTFQILILLTVILILMVILLLLFYKHHEQFIVNPILFTGNDYDQEAVKKMRAYRECHGARSKENCILKKKPFTKHLPIKKLPWVKYVNYQLTRRTSDLLPQYKEPRPHF